MPVKVLDVAAEHARLCEMRLADIVEVREPLVLVSQVQRSGGTLLGQLFDGHPECHAHPGELHIGKPRKWNWPPLDLDRPETWFATLFEKSVYKAFRDGYRKPSRPELDHDVLPFAFLPSLQKSIFEACVQRGPVASEREVIDAYMTSYFNAWLDNANRHNEPKRVVTAFAARLSMDLGNVERFFAAYPDGTLVSIVREPRSWFASARRHRTQYHDLENAMELWCRSTRAILDARDRWGDRVAVLTFDALVRETEKTMTRLSERIGISMHPQLLEPTFNRRPIRANSSLGAGRRGVLPERAEGHRGDLDADAASRVQTIGGGLYEEAVVIAGS
jgi:Sulfotransferase family